ncbi:Cof-type HAD-IIB family hydrolase [Agarivorans sp. MS3-6]|uniref:Cof-type HAD-IIB family hydrolase n=1 Tax=Agarivorans sp. TSD2052 TaxID=2937286 RepID=UPI00200D3F98|nr:Cof-type HAD-IIB family hydrolase [Agarivorans sp. TSD2052]UPW18893.1 Cof-type HAD-IIB family hydrolase [Agarivorans sp. TSD2052]
MYQLIATDLDGTLLNAEHQISEHTLQTITYLYQQNVKFLIATGRHYIDVRPIADQFDFPMYLITSNGARVHNKQGEVLFRADLNSQQINKILAISANYPLHRNIYHEDNWYVEEENEYVRSFNQHSGFNYQVINFDELEHQHICKLFFVAEHDILLKLESDLNKEFGDNLNITFSLPDCLEVMAQKANKGEALNAVLKQKNIAAEDCIAFGDGLNDKEMLAIAGKGVIMANAHDRLKLTLPHLEQTLSNKENGVAEYLIGTFKL